MSTTTEKTGYAHPEVLVDTEWVEKNLVNHEVRVVEVDYDPVKNYYANHIPGSVLFDWKKDMKDQATRDLLSKDSLKELLTRSGVSDKTDLVLYGDYNNWFAAYVFWILKYYGVRNVKLMNGGRKKWLLENRPLSKEIQSYRSDEITRKLFQRESIRAYMNYVKKAIYRKDKILLDVRYAREYSGEDLTSPEYPNECSQVGGHIPGAINVPWMLAVKEDGSFRSVEELKTLYESKGITPEKEVITYCRIGERSSHSWFVLKYLLGYPNVRNYDGSWAEWGNSIRAPVERSQSRSGGVSADRQTRPFTSLG
jgi:thiosulfate/3-mercaptopyruvate sulfurtransferase